MLLSWMDFENQHFGFRTVIISCARWLWFQIFQVIIVRNKDARKQIFVLLSKDEFLYWFLVKAPGATLFWIFLLKHWEEVQIIMESDEGCHPFIETPGVFVPNVTMLVVPVVNVNLQAKAHKLHNVTAWLHCVTILYLNLQAAKQRNPNVFLVRLPHKSTLTSAIDSYSTMSSTLLEEGFPQSTVDFEGLPEICTSYFKRRQRNSWRCWKRPARALS